MFIIQRLCRVLVSRSRQNLYQLSRNFTNQELLPRVSIDKEGKKAQVVIPGYSYGDLDRVAVSNITEWLDAITRCRHLTWDNDFLQMNTRLRQDGMTFITGVRLTPSVPNGINSALRSTNDSQCGIQFTIGLGNIGNSSFETNGSISAVSDSKGESLIKVDYNLFWVYVDRETRKVAKLPNWFVQDNITCCDIPKSSRINIKELAESSQKKAMEEDGLKCVHEQNFIIKNEHIDKFKHTNHEVYIRFITDTMQKYQQAKILANDSSDLGQGHSHFTKFEVLYQGESNEGDEILVQLWERGHKLFGYVLRNGKVIVSSQLELQQMPAENPKSKL